MRRRQLHKSTTFAGLEVGRLRKGDRTMIAHPCTILALLPATAVAVPPKESSANGLEAAVHAVSRNRRVGARWIGAPTGAAFVRTAAARARRLRRLAKPSVRFRLI